MKDEKIVAGQRGDSDENWIRAEIGFMHLSLCTL